MKIRSVWGSSIFGAILCIANFFTIALTGAVIDVPTSGAEVEVNAGTDAKHGSSDTSVLDLLARVRVANEDLYSNLQFFVCTEQIERFKSSLTGQDVRHIDTMKAKVSFENGVEHYTDIFQNTQQRVRISSVPGAWSEGEFGTLLQQTQILLSVLPVAFKTYADVEGTPAAMFQVQISEQNSPWVLEVDRRHYRIPFRTEVWVSRATGQILKIERISTAIPARMRISEMRWGVTLQNVQLDQKSWLLPKTGTYAVLYGPAGRREWNELTFSEYHRYGSQVALRFQ